MKLRSFIFLSLLISPFAAMAASGGKTDGAVLLHPRDAKIAGTAKYDAKNEDIGSWTSTKTKVSWDFELPRAGTYRVLVAYGCINQSAGSTFDVVIGSQKANGTVQSTEQWYRHKEFDLGPVILRKAGAMKLEVVPSEKPAGAIAVMNLRYVKLVKQEP